MIKKQFPELYYFAPTIIVGKEGQYYYAMKYKDKYPFVKSSDASEVIQSCVNALPDGGKIFIRSGTYYLLSPITISSAGIVIEGEGPSTVLTQPDETNLPQFIKLQGPESSYEMFFTLRNIRLEGNYLNNTGTNGIEVPSGYSVHYVWIENCWIHAFPGTCVVQRGRVWYVRGNYITESKSENGTYYVSGADSTYEQNQIGGAGGGAVFKASTLGSSVFVGNKLFGAKDYIMHLDCPVNMVIAGNIIGGRSPIATTACIYIVCYNEAYGKRNIISSNYIYQTDGDGVRLRGSEVKDNIITTNIFYDIGAYAVREYDGTEDYNIVFGNKMINIGLSPAINLSGVNSVDEHNYVH